MKGIIWYESGNMEKAIKQLNIIKKNYLRLLAKTEQDNFVDITLQEKRSSKDWLIVFNNNDCWKIVLAQDNRRGEACNISYIDKDISLDIVNTIIIPSTKAIPYQALKYY